MPLKFRLNSIEFKWGFLQISPNLKVYFANPHTCESYELRYPNFMVFALMSKMCKLLQIPPRVSSQGFPGVYLGFLVLLGFGCYLSPSMVIFYDHFN
jgi:hypothetical protein